MYERLAKVFVLKARNDTTAVVEMGFDPDIVLFTNERFEPVPEKAERGRDGEADD